MLKWEMLGRAKDAIAKGRMEQEDVIGLLPMIILDDDPRDARAQINDRYAHGGGWRGFKGFKLGADMALTYPGDPPFYPVASTQLRDEKIYLYDHEWLLIMQKDGSWEVSRMD